MDPQASFEEDKIAQLIKEKRASNLAKIPAAWRLSDDCGISADEIHENSTRSVLDVPRTCGILTAQEIDLTENHDATALLALLRDGEITSETVVTAFCKRAAVAHQLTNCLTEILFDEAITRARELDAQFAAARGRRAIGPLHGLPISLKDSFNVKGVPATIGYAAFLRDDPAGGAESDSAVVTMLRRLGAVVPFVKTNLPQAMMSAESDNVVFGRTLNPARLCLTAGGSTGGEGALLALRGSVLGVATDVAGSCRIPALCCGVRGFKPTAGRLPFAGGALPGRRGSPASIVPTVGPAGVSVRDLELFARVVVGSDPWRFDPAAVAAPWRTLPLDPKGGKPLRLGHITEELATRPLHPPQLKMMTSLLRRVQGAGHALVRLDDVVPSIYETSLLAWKFFLLDPRKTVLQILKSGREKVLGGLSTLRYPDLEGWNATLDDLWDMNVERQRIIKVYHDLVVEHDLDGILLPTYQATAVPHDTYGIVMYTVLANFLDYPTIALPYLKACKEEDQEFVRKDVAYNPPYTPDLVEGAPCGFQIMGRPMRDEELLQVASIVEECIKGQD